MSAHEARTALLWMLCAYRTSLCLYAVAKLGIADVLRELAQSVGEDAGALYRVLRYLAGQGVFTEDGDGRFAFAPLGEWLRSDLPGTLRPAALLNVEVWWHAWRDLLCSVVTGRPAFDHVHGTRFFDYLSRHPEASALFAATMAGATAQASEAVAAAYECSGAQTVVDVGGGTGALLAAILRTYPRTRGVLFDRPEVVDGAKDTLAAAGVADRCALVGGDPFTAVPEGGDVYLLKWILHDWDDARATAVLRNCRRVMCCRTCKTTGK